MVSTIAWRYILGVAPAYLLELFVLSLSCPGRRSLRSASRGDYTATKQNRAFSAAGPSIWNGLPLELRSLPHYFSSSFIVSLRPSSLPGPGLGALLSSYLEGSYINSIDR